MRAHRQEEAAANGPGPGSTTRCEGAPAGRHCPARRQHRVGRSEIAARAARLKADLVVMGRGGGRAVRDAFLGSTAERVIRQARTPILVIRSPARARYRRPVVGLDVDGAAEPVLAMLSLVIPPPRPRVTIVHAHDGPYLGMYYAGLPGAEREEQELRQRQIAATQIAQVVSRAFRAQKGQPVDVPNFETYVRYGDPRSVIKAAVKKLDTDLLVLGTHAYSGVAHVFLGTVAGDVLRDVRCDVLVVPPAGQGAEAGDGKLAGVTDVARRCPAPVHGGGPGGGPAAGACAHRRGGDRRRDRARGPDRAGAPVPGSSGRRRLRQAHRLGAVARPRAGAAAGRAVVDVRRAGPRHRRAGRCCTRATTSRRPIPSRGSTPSCSRSWPRCWAWSSPATCCSSRSSGS